ncbi:MAG: uL15 family ribosomal protein [Desulfurococcales archaeon]|nr:uL15 family ribosomal protein [Desulfurococcales archaeon]
MVVRRRKKVRKLRGSRTHAWGQVGQHRKSGSKGGVGAVGFEKHKWTWTVKYFPDWYGKHGFTRAPVIQVEMRGINVGRLAELVRTLELRGELQKSGDVYELDLSSLGINKLLGGGRIDIPVKVKVAYATEAAIKKVSEAGGEVMLTSQKKEGEG